MAIISTTTVKSTTIFEWLLDSSGVGLKISNLAGNLLSAFSFNMREL